MIRLALAYFLPGRASGTVLKRSSHLIGMSLGLLICLLVATGCVSTKPVVTSIKKDSTVTRTVSKDSIFDRTTVTDKTIPESNVDMILWNVLNTQAGHGSTLDSIARALKNLPKGTPQVITIPDQKGRAQLQFILDALGEMKIRCVATEQHYKDSIRMLIHINSQLANAFNEKKDQEKETKIIDNRGFWDKTPLRSKLVIWAIAFSIPFIIGIWVKGRLEKVSWAQNIFSVFTRKKDT